MQNKRAQRLISLVSTAKPKDQSESDSSFYDNDRYSDKSFTLDRYDSHSSEDNNISMSPTKKLKTLDAQKKIEDLVTLQNLVEVTEIYSNEQTENLVENNNLMPIIINEIETELVPNQEEVEADEGIPIENKKIRKKKLSLKNKRRKTRKMRTERRNHGEEYQSEGGKIVAARKLKDLVKCRKKCKERFCDSDRQCIFNEYWSLGSHSKRMSFISSLITSDEKNSEKKKIKDVKKQKLEQKNLKSKHFEK